MLYRVIRLGDEDSKDIELAPITTFHADAEVLYRFEAPSWEEAMAEHHRRQGFEPYKPEGPAVPCPRCSTLYYPEGSGDCPGCSSIQVQPVEDFTLESMISSARSELAHGFKQDNVDHKTVIALCEELQRHRASK